MPELQSPSIKNRSPYWDNMKGVLISLVVLGHFLWGYLGLSIANTIICFIYLFHIPAFSFVAGFLSRSDNSRSNRSILRLCVIYLVFNTIMMLFSRLLMSTSYQLITPYYSFWFLISLVVWRLTIGYIGRIRGVLFISAAVAVTIGFWADVTNVLTASRTVVFLPFFIAGYQLSADKIDTFISSRKPMEYLKGMLLLLCTLIMSFVIITRFTGLGQSQLLMESYKSLFDCFARIAILGVAGLMTVSLVMLTPSRPVPLLCRWGRNSLAIYVLHRYLTLIFLKAFPAAGYTRYYIIYAFCAAALTLLLLGSDTVTRVFNRILDRLIGAFSPGEAGGRWGLIQKTSVLLLVLLISLPVLSLFNPKPADKNSSLRTVQRVMTGEQGSRINKAVSVAFVGDLILLQDQVRKGYSGSSGGYDFGPMFEYASRYLKEADYAIGVFEGPLAGEGVGYTTSNYDDGLPVCLNFPDSFARAVRDSGIDLVSTANNHLLDKGEAGALRTLDVLDGVGLSHVGSYRNAAEKDSISVVEVRGVRIAVLAYTSGSNGYNDEYFLNDNTSITSILVDPRSRHFEEVKARVLSDFQRIKEMNNPPDLIAVIPHMGTQFTHQTDKYQDTWNDIFIKAGADIVLGDHSHAVQPIEFRTTVGGDGREKRAVIVNSPGNFANSYIEKDGDATSIVEVYIDPKTKELVCAGVIPMYTQSPSRGVYRALPVYSILTDKTLQGEIGTYEMGRVAQVEAVVSSVMLGTELTLDQSQPRHFLFPDGYVRQPAFPVDLTEEMRSTVLYRLLSGSKTVCFVGDSVTAGSENGGYGWYEPLAAAFPDSTVYQEAWGGATTKTLLERSDLISGHRADLYVIAIGVNDVRYRDKSLCAMDAGAYVDNIDLLVGKILGGNPRARFVFIKPWLAMDNDPYTALTPKDRDLMLDEYGKALKSYCGQKGYCFIDPNPAIDEVLTKNPPSEYLIDHIHPNAREGIALYSEKTLQAAEKR